MKAILALEDGTVVHGTGFGARGIALGELVFATSITGYEEALTDPSYNGQILMLTYPLIGNYEVSKVNLQSDSIKAEGFVVREICDHPSHHLSKLTLEEYLKSEGIPGMCEVDTRMLTIKTRKFGTMLAALIVDEKLGKKEEERALELARNLKKIFPTFDLVVEVTCKQAYSIQGEGKRFVVLDCGVKRNIIKNLAMRNLDLVVVPSTASYEEIKAFEPDALLISNGPGDPVNVKNVIGVVKQFLGKLPIFGICLGHQIIALALGAATYKLKFGHRGANQPVKDFESGIVYITSQNHGYAVNPETLAGTGLEVTQINANDGTIEGMRNRELAIESVQYHPEASPGPRDTSWFFDKIVEMVEVKR
ncbi:MAG: glutamine-hydrolyzing carbamoyl-phosphate synthase small subunit [Halobacteria archaeon]